MLMETEQLRYAVWLQTVLHIGNAHIKKIFEYFGTPETIWRATDAMRKESGVLTPTECRRCLEIPFTQSDTIIETCRQNGISICTYFDPEYPDCLKNIDDPPLVLYYKGDLPNFGEEPTFCIVGPRKVSDFGQKSAYSLARRLALAGFVIVSGCAAGGDTAAHKGVLNAAGKSVCVLPCGFLKANTSRVLQTEIIRGGGCVISECPPQLGVMRYAFHARNRLLSALSLGVAVVEAGEHSGALITARHACEQGKDVFVIPGNPTLPQYSGSNALLRDGARPLLDASDIFGEYLSTFADKIDMERAFQKSSKAENNKKIQKKSTEPLSKEGKIVYNYLDKQKFTADDLLACGLSQDILLSVLTELEVLGYIECLPGGYYAIR